jgi:hydroxymethylpyrimidine/phosphomethylpyrimidine kinase
MKRDSIVLLVAGSDPSGGAGLELDLAVCALHGVHAAAVATCHTFQTAVAMEGLVAASRPIARRQLALVARDASIGAVKVGMVPNAAWAALVAAFLDRHVRAPFVVLDPVLAPTIGPRVGGPSLLRALVRTLLPRVDLVTPNAVEAAELLAWSPSRVAREPDAAARALLDLGPRAVLLKGGHLPTRSAREPVVDRLRGGFGEFDLAHPRQRGVSPRGTGCALASAIAARVATGVEVARAVRLAETWLQLARREARSVGRGRPQLGRVVAARVV